MNNGKLVCLKWEMFFFFPKPGRELGLNDENQKWNNEQSEHEK